MFGIRERRDVLRLLHAGLSPSEVSRRTGISRSTVRTWRQRLDLGDAECPRCDGIRVPGPAYAALLGFYLGDGCVSKQRGYYSLRISCDEAWPHVVRDVTALISRVRPTHAVFHVSAPGTVVVHANWKHWPCLFPQHGPGRKHDRPIALADWQRTIVEQHPEAFLRGLFHSDGSRTRNWATRRVGGAVKRYEYPRWEFANRSADIIGLCCWALELAGVPYRVRRVDRVAVSRRDAVARLDELIGPKG